VTELDYAHDSLAEIALKSREIIEAQGYRMLFLAMENQSLRDDADSVIAAEHERLKESFLLVKTWIYERLREGKEWMDARAMLEVIRDCLAYGEEGEVPEWFAAAKAAAREAEKER
jgi:hypothetical protein